jgi:N-acetylneuraminic acid mutarotase
MGKFPGDRAAHSCDLIGGRLYVFGGWNGINALADIYIYCLNLNTWTEVVPVGETPSYRNNHTTAVHQSKLYVHGGHNGAAWMDDLYYLETSS